MEELELEEEALLLNREMLTEIKNLIDDINDTKPSYLRQFKHPQWGSILGSEEDIRILTFASKPINENMKHEELQFDQNVFKKVSIYEVL